MASRSPQSEEECTCTVCCELFTDPVVLLCGHSFCTYCLQEWWKQIRIQTCPVCKERFPLSRPPPNLALRNLTDAVRKEKLEAESGSEQLCSLHGEKLKLFCRDDQQAICLICRDAKEHKKHDFVPVSEAAEEFRVNLRVGLMHLKTSQSTSKSEKELCESMTSYIQFQAQQTENSIREEFQKLHQSLHADETERINAVRKEAEFKAEEMKKRVEKWNAEILSVTKKVQTIEEQIETEDALLLQNIKSTIQSLEHTSLHDPVPFGALIDQAKHLGNLQYSIWKKMSNSIKFSPVILDPNTAGSYLNVSSNLTSTTESQKDRPFPNSPDRWNSLEILGYEGFSSGKHRWDVEVSDQWGVGIVTKTSKRTWGIRKFSCNAFMRQLQDLSEINKGSSNDSPQKIRVELDYSRGDLSFFDLGRNTHIHTIRDKFTETVFPYFSESVTVLQLNVSAKPPKP